MATVIGYTDSAGIAHYTNYAGSSSYVTYTPRVFSPNVSARSFADWVTVDNSPGSPLMAFSSAVVGNTDAFVFNVSAGETVYTDPVNHAGFTYEVLGGSPLIIRVIFENDGQTL